MQLQPGYLGGVLAWHVPGIVDQVEFPEGRTITGPLPFTVIGDNIFVYKSSLKLTPLMEILERFREKNT